jgi:hypothetical protein
MSNSPVSETQTTKLISMKIYSKIITASVMAVLALNAQATIYSDTTGGNVWGDPVADITSVEVTHNATDLIFKINLAGDPVAANYAKYMVGLDTSAGGDTAGNGWNRPIGMSSGMDYWYGTWADSGNGAEVYKYTGSWSLQNATYGIPGGLSFSKDTSSVTITYPFASLGLNLGNTFTFDVYTSGGGSGDGAVDALSNPSQSIANWGDYYNSGSLVGSYTLTAVPEPTSLALLGIGAALVIGRIRRR